MRHLRLFEQHAKADLINFGSSRRVYSAGNGRVIKKTYTGKKGQAQNQTEVFLSGQDDVNGILTKVFGWSEDYGWIEAERAGYVGEDEITGYIPFFHYLNFYFMYKQGVGMDFTKEFLGSRLYGSRKSYRSLFREYDNDYFVQKLLLLITKYGLEPNDLENYKNYGLVNNELRLVDYGLQKKD